MSAQKKARTGRVGRRLSTPHQPQKSLAFGSHSLHLLFGIHNAAARITLVITAYVGMTVHHGLNAAPLAPTGLHKEQIEISVIHSQFDVVVLSGLQKASPDPVHHRIPLGTPSDPEVAAKPGPKANQAGDKTHDASIRVNPGREFSWLHWLSFWGLCLFLGFALSQIIAPRQK